MTWSTQYRKRLSGSISYSYNQMSAIPNGELKECNNVVDFKMRRHEGLVQHRKHFMNQYLIGRIRVLHKVLMDLTDTCHQRPGCLLVIYLGCSQTKPQRVSNWLDSSILPVRTSFKVTRRPVSNYCFVFTLLLLTFLFDFIFTGSPRFNTLHIDSD